VEQVLNLFRLPAPPQQLRSVGMPGARTKELSPKHYKALELIAENTMSLKEIAKASGIPEDNLYDLCEGNPSTGNTGVLFQIELDKVLKQLDKKTRISSKKLRNTLHRKLEKWAFELPAQLEDSHVRRAVELLNSVHKAIPQIEIGEVHYHKGMDQEDIVNEFKRLSAIARLTSDGIAIQKSSPRGTREILESLGRGSEVPQEQEDTILPPDSQTRRLPRQS
jgi:hypothetical protein